MWLLMAGTGTIATSGIWDGRMKPMATDGEPGPFEWRLLSSDRWETQFNAKDGGIVADGNGPFVSRLADTHIVLAPGNYRIEWQASVTSDGMPDIRLTPICAQPEFDLAVRQTPSQGNSHSVQFNVPANCNVVQMRAMAFPDGSNRRWLRAPRIN
ncbi:MAG: hypothetical protein IPL18_12000 [Sphingomonadales bacterium]|nr:hypothetical protein [Sphingomonadales bacterium]